MAAILNDCETGILIDSGFPCGSAGDITTTGPGIFRVCPKSEAVPAWFESALTEHFGGAGVPREYAFHVRIRHMGIVPYRISVRFDFTESCGKSYMGPPYWVSHRNIWRKVLPADTDFHEGSHVILSYCLEPGQSIFLANKPYVSPVDVENAMADLSESNGAFSVRQIGVTDQGRPLQVLESNPRPESIMVSATMQPAEPAARPVLAVAHALTDGSALSQRLLDRFQFCFLPMPNPDGAYHGRSVTNDRDEVPMFSFGHVIRGEHAPVEAKAIWDYCSLLRPTAFMEFHTHYQDNRSHKLNPMWHGWFSEHVQERVSMVDEALLGLNQNWRVTKIAPEIPLHECGKFSNLTRKLGTMSYCYQIYTATEEATCAHAVRAVNRLAIAMAGAKWESDAPEPVVREG
ncbi:MAG: hypothetical protein HOH43_04960 [Candidatus Latescibacteria bacterium]|nr:hypothetical protein [Candidatus Latescibacterota bacterium]